MKKLILIASIFAISCSKDCYISDFAGNTYKLTKEIRTLYNEYEKTGTTTINGITYYKSKNDLIETCN